jgi:hypothetical protein
MFLYSHQFTVAFRKEIIFFYGYVTFLIFYMSGVVNRHDIFGSHLSLLGVVLLNFY